MFYVYTMGRAARNKLDDDDDDDENKRWIKHILVGGGNGIVAQRHCLFSCFIMTDSDQQNDSSPH